MYSNRVLQQTSCRAANAFDVGSAMQAAFCYPTRSASRVVAKAALNARWMSADADSAESKTGNGQPLKRGSRRWQTHERSNTGVEDEAQHARQNKNDQAATEKMQQYEMLLRGTGHKSPEKLRISREEAIGRYAKSGAAKTVAPSISEEERLIEEGKNTANGWTEHMLRFSQKLRDPETRKSMTQEDYDYIGLPIEPQQTPLESSLPIPWALDVKERRDLTASQLLDEEIRHFVLYMQPTTMEKNGRIRVAEDARKRAHTIFGEESNVGVFGSSATSTDMPFSDIDLCVNTKGLSSHQHENGMYRLSQELGRSQSYICVVYRGGKFPIITAQHANSGIDVQFVAGVNYFQVPRIGKLLDKTEHLRSLYSVVRTMLGIRGFVNPFIGGISAYGAMLMVAASIKLKEQSENVLASDSAASHLFHYLDLFANFETTKHALSVSPPLMVPKHADQRDATLFRDVKGPMRPSEAVFRAELHRMARICKQQPYLLCLQDPTNPVNDLGGRCHAIKHILRTIQHLNAELRSSMLRYDEAREQGKPLQGEVSLLLPLVGRCHEVYAERRAKLTEHTRHCKMERKSVLDQETRGRRKAGDVRSAAKKRS